MGTKIISGGLPLTVPTDGTRNWGPILETGAWNKIATHSHTGANDGNKIGTSALVDNSVTTVKLSKNYGYTQQALQTPAGTSETIDWDLGNVAQLSLVSATGNVILTLNNPAQGSKYLLFITNGFRNIGSDVSEAGSTTNVINATAHAALAGDQIEFTSGALNGTKVIVKSVTANSITVVDTLSSAPGIDSFNINRQNNLVFPANVKWPQGVQVLLTKLDNAIDYIEMYYNGTDFRVLNWELDIK